MNRTTCKLILGLLASVTILASCTNKEDKVKSMLGIPQGGSEQIDPVALAEKDPTFDNLTAAGLSLSQSQQHSLALTYFLRSLEKDPNSSLANNNICAEYNGLQQWDNALPYCQKAVDLAPDFQLAQNNLNYAKEQKKAQLNLIESLTSKSQSAQGEEKRIALLELGLEYYKMNKFTDAIQTWDKVERAKDDITVRLLNNLGSAHILLKQFPKAKSALNEALKLDPENQLVKNNLAWLQSASEASASK